MPRNVRTSALGVAGIVLIASSFGVGSLATASDAGSSVTDVWCERTTPVVWTTTSTLRPGASDVERVKDVTLDGDVAIDGWTNFNPSGVDAWQDVTGAHFRVIVGTLHDLDNVQARITLDSAVGSFNAPGAPTSPAGGATPIEYQEVTLTDLAAPQRSADFRTIDWDVTTGQALPANSSAQFSVDPDLTGLQQGTDPIVITLTLTGDLTAGQPCNDQDGDGYTDSSHGDRSLCSVDWRAASTTDRRLSDYSNNGYRAGVLPALGKGYLKFHHWLDTADPKLNWRIPIATDHPIEAGATLVLIIGDNWTLAENPVIEDLTGQLWVGNEPNTLFNRFTGIDGYQSVPSDSFEHAVVNGQLIITLPEMPADSHILLQFTGVPITGVDILNTDFPLDGTLTGTYSEQTRDKLGCTVPSPEPSLSAGSTVVPEPPATPEPTTSEPTVSPEPSDIASESALAKTGVDSVPRYAAIGAFLVTGGALILVLARRRFTH